MRYVRPPRMKVTRSAKIKAAKALKLRNSLPESQKFGIDRKDANKLGIASGVDRAKQLVRSDSIPYPDAEKVARFYQRFKNKTGPRAEGAIDLWGGRQYGREAVSFVRASKKSKGYVRQL